ncbi:Mu transposase C-terminal domain-containing protein [Microvirga massiliensis]|uniref:Mu transposase C-terminal domain-containing protein n=1 Tax=Microvirga massiliensis TaxID=1033741 RepID=UPI00062BEAFD|nr:Mu transposase C-terminal domain-containing protein [Microvirga massiliensis]
MEPARASEKAWQQAKWYARVLEHVLASRERRGTAIARAARELNLTTRQVYTLLARFEQERVVSALLPRAKNPRKRREQQVETIIELTLRELWLVLEGTPLAPVVEEIRARCEQVGARRPSYNTVAARIPLLFTAEEIAKKRTANEQHLRRLKPRPGYIHAPHPLAVCQMDHTQKDIKFLEVSDEFGEFVGRPYLTINVDVATRCILGFCLTLEKPSRLSVALCLAHSLCPKDDWLKEHGLDHHPWPTYGRPKILHVDSAKEFQSVAFEQGCDEYQIKIKYRNRGCVHTGGVVERLLGKLNTATRTFPGTTGRSVADRDRYPSEELACLTFAELEKCVALAIVEHNTNENRKTLKVPLTEWKCHAASLPRFNDDPKQVLLTFLPGPREGRSLFPQGIRLFGLEYYEPHSLGPLVPERDRLGKLHVKYDPRDISHIYVRHPHTQEYLAIPRRDGESSRVTLWEFRETQAVKRAQNQRSSVEQAKPRREREEIAQNARQRKAASRASARNAHAAKPKKPYEEMVPPPAPPGAHPIREKRRLIIEEW